VEGRFLYKNPKITILTLASGKKFGTERTFRGERETGRRQLGAELHGKVTENLVRPQ